MQGAVRADLAGVAEAELAALVLFLRTIPMAVTAVGAAIAGAAAVRERTPANMAGAAAEAAPCIEGLYNLILKGRIQHGNGEVWITEISVGAPVPEPATLALMSTGLAGLASLAALRLRREG